MVQLYGKRYVSGGDNSGAAVPLILTPDLQIKPRNSVEEVYKQINTDLDTAINLLATSTARPNKSYHDGKVAKGLKARVALAQQNWTLAASMAAEARTGYTPMSTALLTSGFNDITNPEWMWGLAQQADQQTNFYSFFAYMGNFSSTNTRTNPKAINNLLYNSMSTTDNRRKLWDPTGTNTSFPLAYGGVRKPYMSGKFLIKPSGGGISIGDLPFMRAAEMYLIEAEARARAGQNTEAANALYQLISVRDPSYVQSTNTGDALIAEIMKHRRIELWGEGFRFYDLKRTNTSLDRTGANHDAAIAYTMQVPAGDKTWQFLIPQTEIDASGKIVTQNDL
jgi:starch-binding outer membrane protein, SusD/RagB family